MTARKPNLDFIRLRIAILATAALTGCSGQAGDASKSAQSQPSRVTARSFQNSGPSSDQGYIVKWSSAPNPLPLNEPFDIVFSVTPMKHSSESDKLEVAVDAAMPSHGHGMNTQPSVQHEADGSYVARGLLFHMSGHWELYFDITAGNITERAQFGLDLE